MRDRTKTPNGEMCGCGRSSADFIFYNVPTTNTLWTVEAETLLICTLAPILQFSLVSVDGYGSKFFFLPIFPAFREK